MLLTLTVTIICTCSEWFHEQDDLIFQEMDNFRGCLEKLKYNSLDVIESSFALRDGLKNVDYECSREFDVHLGKSRL